MNDDYVKDDALGRLIRKEGLLRTSPGFTDRVMQLVESSAQKKSPTFAPLISGKLWKIIALAVAFLILISIVLSATGHPGQSSTLSKIKSLTDVLSLSHITLILNEGMTTLVTMIMAIVSLLLFLDFALTNRLRGLLK